MVYQDCYTRSFEQGQLYGDRQSKPILRRCYRGVDAMGWVWLGNQTRQR